MDANDSPRCCCWNILNDARKIGVRGKRYERVLHRRCGVGKSTTQEAKPVTGALLVTACFLWEQGLTDALNGETSKRVRQWVRQLNAPQRMERQDAERALVELGPEALRHLPDLDSRMPAETKVRLGRIINELEQRLVLQSSQASMVTLQGRMELGKAWAALQRQTGNRTIDLAGAETEVTADYRKLPYWQVVDRLLDQAELDLNPHAGNRLALTTQRRSLAGRGRYGAAAYTGLFRLEATHIQAVRGLRNSRPNHLQVVLEVAWEPRLTPLSLSLPLAEIKATLKSGRILKIPSPGVRFARAMPDMSSVELDLPLALPARNETHIASLRGKLSALVPGRITAFEFVDLNASRGKRQRRAGVSVTYEDLRKRNDSGVFEVRIRLRFDRANQALESHRGWVYRNEIELVDQRGKKADLISSENYSQGRNETGIGYLFALDGEPSEYRLIYKTPALMIPVSLPFELVNLPLP